MYIVTNIFIELTLKLNSKHGITVSINFGDLVIFFQQPFLTGKLIFDTKMQLINIVLSTEFQLISDRASYIIFWDDNELFILLYS